MKAIVVLLAAIASAATLAAANVPATTRYGSQKVVYHVNEEGGAGDAAYLRTLNFIQNHVNAVGRDNIAVTVVLHGAGVDLLKNAVTNLRLQSQVASVKTQNVSFAVCRNTLVSRHLDPDKDLFEVFEEDIVPSGVAELSHLQQRGYTYIKP